MLSNKQVEFNIRTLLLLEEHLNVPIDSLIFDAEITDEVQAIVAMYGMKLNDKELEEYLTLKEPEKLSVDLKVNGALFDALGLGKQSSEDTTIDTDAKVEVKFFKEYIKEFLYYCVGVLHMSKADFMSYTPVEVYAILEAHRNNVKYQYNIDKLAHINAIGLTSSKKFKEINPFDGKQDKKVKKIDTAKKKSDLDFLMNRVGE